MKTQLHPLFGSILAAHYPGLQIAAIGTQVSADELASLLRSKTWALPKLDLPEFDANDEEHTYLVDKTFELGLIETYYSPSWEASGLKLERNLNPGWYYRLIRTDAWVGPFDTSDLQAHSAVRLHAVYRALKLGIAHFFDEELELHTPIAQ